MNNNQIAEEIVKTFEGNFLHLSPKHQSHWSVRRFRQTQNPSYKQPILTDFQLRTLRIYPWLLELENSQLILQIDQELLGRYSNLSPKKARRLAAYKNNPTLLFYRLIVEYLVLGKNLGFDQVNGWKETFNRAKKHLQTIDLSKLYLNDDFIGTNPSAAANMTGYLRSLEIVDLEAETHQKFKDYWLQKEVVDDIDRHLKIYSMTHIVIATSDYYQHPVEPEKVQWILDYFEENIDEIIAQTTPDIVAEVGMAFKLAGVASPAYHKARDFVARAFNAQVGFIPRSTEEVDLEKAEHRNILAVLLLSDATEWHTGPNLSDFVAGKSFYLPKEIELIGKSNEYEKE